MLEEPKSGSIVEHLDSFVTLTKNATITLTLVTLGSKEMEMYLN